jgi:very-short-patch-repair endonuclease
MTDIMDQMPKRQTLTVQHAKRLRRGETDAERKLWMHLRSRQVNGAKFRRQQPIGRYIVDFFCPENRLVIELDGGHHAGQVEADHRRTDCLTMAGYRVLRFWDNDVQTEPKSVLQKISDELNYSSPRPSPSRGEGLAKKTPHPHPLPQGAREKNAST